MKAIKKLALVLAALATVFAFASCSDDDDDDDEGWKPVTTWVHEETETDSDTNVSYTNTTEIYFYENSTFKIVYTGGYYQASHGLARGTYTGDTTQASSTITLTATEIVEYLINEEAESSTKLVDNTSDDYKNVEATISSDGKTLTLNYEKYTKQ